MFWDMIDVPDVYWSRIYTYAMVIFEFFRRRQRLEVLL